MTPIAVIALRPDPALSIPFRVHASADGSRLAVLNTFGMPYAQELLVIDTHSHEVVWRHEFAAHARQLFNLDLQLSGDGRTVVLAGGMLENGDACDDICRLTVVDVDSGTMHEMPAGPLGFNFVSIVPDRPVAYVFHNGNNIDQVQFYAAQVVDLERMEVVRSLDLQAPVNNVLYRVAEGRALFSMGREVVAFDLARHEVGERVAPRFNHPYLLAAFAPEEPLIYAAYVASQVVVKTIDVQKRSVVAQHSFSWPWTASTNIVAFGRDHLIFPPSSSAGAICLWNRHTGEIDARAGLPDHMILSTPHPNGRDLYLFDYHDQSLKLVEAAAVFDRSLPGDEPRVSPASA